MKRKMSVNGTFYPAREIELERYFEHFSNIYDEQLQIPNIQTKAVIVPHAGYIYSGFSANVAYRVLAKSGIENFLVIGPSHRIAFKGSSLCDSEAYETPFGDLQNSPHLLELLQKEFELKSLFAHEEHSTEVQFPFIKHYIPHAKIVELIYSNEEPKFISKIINFVLAQGNCGVIVSTDLSHFYNLNIANELDNICLDAIENLDVEQLQSGCEACGIIGVEAMIMSAKKLHFTPKLLDYRTSADASGDEERVVGYLSACFEYNFKNH